MTKSLPLECKVQCRCGEHEHEALAPQIMAVVSEAESLKTIAEELDWTLEKALEIYDEALHRGLAIKATDVESGEEYIIPTLLGVWFEQINYN